MGNRNLFTGRRCRCLRDRAAVEGGGMNAIDHTADWRTKLTQAMAGVSNCDYMKLSHDASGWFTCACGQLDDYIKRDTLGSPCDRILRVRGSKFFGEVRSKNYARALATLNAIEQRAMELKP